MIHIRYKPHVLIKSGALFHFFFREICKYLANATFFEKYIFDWVGFCYMLPQGPQRYSRQSFIIIVIIITIIISLIGFKFGHFDLPQYYLLASWAGYPYLGLNLSHAWCN